jgi:4'-phosphopantetheinyl transferase
VNAASKMNHGTTLVREARRCRLRSLSAGAVHVWLASADSRCIRTLWRQALPRELRDARALRDSSARVQHILSRFLVRRLVPRYAKARHWRISHERGHAPVVHPRRPRLTISVAHSGDTVAVAFSRSTGIGVDIEVLPKPDGLTLGIARYLDPSESAGAGGSAIWQAWCRKEALLKALGMGLRGLTREFPCVPSPRTLFTHSTIVGRWLVESLHGPTRLAIAYATDDCRARVQIQDFKFRR